MPERFKDDDFGSVGGGNINTVVGGNVVGEDGDDDGSHTNFSGLLDLDQQGVHKEVKEMELAKKEDKWVWGLRVLTSLALLTVAVIVCVAVYLEGRASEQQDFEQDFTDLGEKLVTSFEATVQQRMGIFNNFGMDITANANGSWPFVTPKDFAPRIDAVARLTHSMQFALIPRVQEEQLQEWNNYTLENYYGWMKESWSFMYGTPLEETHVKPPFPAMMNVHYGGPPKPQDEPGPYYPIWCLYPVNNGTVSNIDIGADVEHIGPMESVFETGKPAFENSYDYWTDIEKDRRYEGMIRSPVVSYQHDPFGVMFYPVFDGFGKDKKVVALFLNVVYWRTYFDGLLPPGSDGIIVILENTCGQQYTYQVDGSNAVFIDRGDLHDTKYDYLGTGISIDSIFEEGNKNETNTELATASCHYSIRVYPSQVFEDDRTTNKPLLYATVLAALFIFTSCVFLLYDWMVERRQKIVMQSALQSGALVSSLFPEAVRDRLYEEQQAHRQSQEKKANWENTSNNNDTMDHKEAIASLYPESTIFFADLAGFTKWSSTRTPVEVFQLLEALYGEFDKIAARRRVFKVETIGDCFAITGVPQAQKDHAVIMAKFAADCMTAMGQLISSELAHSLGSDTAELKMRVGMHSGPVTAGVLRGEKARFQLFGDTVNTASRMESNGLPGCIQASLSTTELLVAAGKKAWVTEREGGIEAKGKGRLRTFWITPRSIRASTMSQCSERIEEQAIVPGAMVASIKASLASEVAMIDEGLSRNQKAPAQHPSHEFDDERSM